MSLKRFVLCSALLLLGVGVAATAQSATYSLVSPSGAQYSIGGGLPIPIQTVMTTGGASMNPTALGTNFPPLLIPAKAGATVMQTLVKTTLDRQITVPAGVFSKPAAQKTVGLFAQNPTLYAVATNLKITGPYNKAAVFNTVNRTGAANTSFTTNSLSPTPNKAVYVAPASGKFGGPARFGLSAGAPAGLMPQVAVTIFAVAVPAGGAGNPPCAHPAFGGANPACVAALGAAVNVQGAVNTMTATGAIGGAFNQFVSTPGGTPSAFYVTAPGAMTQPTGTKVFLGTMTQGPGPKPGVGIIKALGTPVGTISLFFFTPNGTKRGFTNMASSYALPWTVGKLKLSAPGAKGAPEVFTITGMDSRTAAGGGTIQLVAGSLSQRTKSGPNANRAWLRLTMASGVPAMSPSRVAAAAGLLLLVGAYAVRRFSSKV